MYVYIQFVMKIVDCIVMSKFACGLCTCYRVTPVDRFWSAHLFPPSSTGRESLSCGHRICMWLRMQGTKMEEQPSGSVVLFNNHFHFLLLYR